MTTRTLYILRYDDHMYPEDNEILGCSWVPGEMEQLITDTIAFHAATKHGQIYKDSYHRLCKFYYYIDEIETPPIPEE